MRGFFLAEQAHTVLALAPVDINGGKTSAVWSHARYPHASIMIEMGVTGGASTVTIEACDDFVPTTPTAVPFAVYKCETASGDVLGDRFECTATGFVTSLNDGIWYRIEIDAADLPIGQKNARVKFSNPGATTLAAVNVVLSNPRYGHKGTSTVLS